MKVLVLNSGSSSLKYQLIETKNGEAMCRGVFERIGESEPFYEHKIGDGEMITTPIQCKNHGQAVKRMLELVAKSLPLTKLDAIGHRVVHGGEVFKGSAIATADNLVEVEKLTPLAPLHNPANIVGLRECLKVLPNVPNVMVFDTAFHATIPAKAYMYAIPAENYELHKIRRYGFHGTSHNFVAKAAAKMYASSKKLPSKIEGWHAEGVTGCLKNLKIITCHIGNGGSVCAVDRGVSVETSMGATPLEGLIMGTRSGDIDPAVIEILCSAHKMTVSECIQYLNKKSGLLGLSGINNDMRDLMSKRDKNPAAQLAIDCFCHRLTKYIGAYAAVMNGVDIIVWTGGIGNNQNHVRAQVMKNFAYLGAQIDENLNNKLSGVGEGKNLTSDISAKGARVKTYVINTNEELEIATETAKAVSQGDR